MDSINRASVMVVSVADLEGVRGVRPNLSLGSKLFHFHGEFLKNIGKMVKSNPQQI